MAASCPKVEKGNGLLLRPRIVAATLSATARPSRRACCAVGGLMKSPAPRSRHQSAVSDRPDTRESGDLEVLGDFDLSVARGNTKRRDERVRGSAGGPDESIRLCCGRCLAQPLPGERR